MIVLMDRAHSGVNVALTWHGESSFSLDVTDPLGTVTVPVNGADALDAFHHPYLYLDADRGNPFDPRRRAEDDADIIGADTQDAPLGTIDPRD